jgi:proteasome lid subunit RPN8/RPN11
MGHPGDQTEQGRIDQLGIIMADTIVPHVMEDPSRESGGFLIGSSPKNLSEFPEVSLALRARRVIGSRNRLTFTQNTWLELYSELEDLAKAGEQNKVVGWYHSHPSGVIFLSTHDEFIHNHFFAAPHQIAVVIDPVLGDYGVFVWENGEIARSLGFQHS